MPNTVSGTLSSHSTANDLEPFPSYHNTTNRKNTHENDNEDVASLTNLSIISRSRTSSITKPNEPVKDHRRRRSSSIISHVEQETLEDENDQQLFPNLNVTWISSRGAWLIHLVIIVMVKLFYNLLPGLYQSSNLSWTLTNVTYNVGCYIMFHMIKGTPFDFNGGAYDNLTMWEQIDNETLYTPSRKFIFSVPIALFLIMTHYTNFNLKFFTFNFLITFIVGIVPKLALTHRLRIFIPGITQPQQIS